MSLKDRARSSVSSFWDAAEAGGGDMVEVGEERAIAERSSLFAFTSKSREQQT